MYIKSEKEYVNKFSFIFVFLGIIVIIALQFFTPYLVYIPKAALAAVIIAAVVFMVELQVVKPMWRTKSTNYYIFSIL